MKQNVNILKSAAVALLVATLMLAGCSRKGVHMSKHRKSRKCNCPTFAENTQNNTDASSISYDQRGCYQL